MRLFDRKPVMLVSLGITTICCWCYSTIRLCLKTRSAVTTAVIAQRCRLHFQHWYGVGSDRPAIGDIVDENELLTGERQEGLFFLPGLSKHQLRGPFLCRSYAGVHAAPQQATGELDAT